MAPYLDQRLAPMNDFEIRAVGTGQERRQFLRLPWDLYRDDSNWIPPLRGNQKQLVGYKRHPFYDNAEVQTFIAVGNGQVCGRVAAIINHAHNRANKEKIGFLGFFESIDQQQVANGLFDAARDWFTAKGLQSMRGPANPSLNYECGLLVDGKDSPPMFMMTYNPLFYGQLWENYGFQKVQDLYAYWGHVDMLKGLDKKLEFITNEAKRRFNIKLRCLDKSRFVEDVRVFLDIYNKSLVGTWGFVPLSDGEITHLARDLRHLIVPELTCTAEVDGRPVGTAFGLLDYNPRIRKINGRLFPFGFLQLMTNRRALKRMRLISTNVLPEYQRWGVGLVLLNGLLPSILRWGLEEGEFSWVLESNQLSRASLERGGAIRYKTYRIYDFPLRSP